MVAQEVQQAYYRILLVLLLKEFIKLNVSIGIITKNGGKCGIKYTDCEYCLEHTIVKDDLIEYKCLCCKKNYQTRFKGN